MLPYRKTRAIQGERTARFVRETERAEARRRAARNEPGGLSELLNSLAQGLVAIGIPGRTGQGFPAGPAY